MRLTDDPRPLSITKPDTSWPAEVQAVMAKALQRKKEDRYDSASKFGIALYQAVEHMPKAAAAGATQMIGAMDGATAVMTPPPKTRLDASPAAAPAPVVAATPPMRSKMPVYAGAGVAALTLATAAIIYFPKAADKSGATPPAGSAAVVPSETPVTAPPVATQQNVGAPKGGGRTGGTKAVDKLSAPLAGGTKAPVTSEPATSGAISYARELEAIYASVIDVATSKAALDKVSELESKVTSAADKAALAFIEAKATTSVVGATKGCRMMQLVRGNNLPASMKADFDDGLSACK